MQRHSECLARKKAGRLRNLATGAGRDRTVGKRAESSGRDFTKREGRMSTISDLVRDEALVADSYERVKGDLAAVPVDQLAPVNLDVQTISRLILGALPEMRRLRDR